MDLEHLTKHQIVLLTLLVSFVTSIATGIVTVSLMSQAPLSVTRTINQIVERTVETVVPQSQNAAVVQKTLVVKDDDLAAQSIANVQKSIIRITAKGGEQLLARGVIINKNGTALSDAAALVGAEEFDAILSDGTRVPVVVAQRSATSSVIVVDVVVGTSTAWAPAVFADNSKLRLGQSVIRIGGRGVDAVATGVIATLPTGAQNAAATIEASVQSITPGSVLITLFGEVVGITTTASLLESPGSYAIAKQPTASN